MNPVLMFLVTMLLSSSGAGTVQTVIKSGQDHHEVLINKYDCSAVQGFNYLLYVTNFYFLYNDKSSVRIPNVLFPRTIDNHNNYIISLGKLAKWMAEQAG